jgi:hypothetical protein
MTPAEILAANTGPASVAEARLYLNQVINGLERIQRGCADAPLVAEHAARNLSLGLQLIEAALRGAATQQENVDGR